jgi:general secretion pathway protein A
MYEKFYGFTEKPFHLVANPRFLYLSNKHQNALTYLEYGLSEGAGFILLTGDIGAGKTTTVRHILNRIENSIEVGVIFNTNVDSGELLDLVLREFGLESASGGKTKALEAIFQYLVKKYAQKKRVLLVIDEAQNLSVKALEEVRMLSNLQTDDQMLLQIMLVGQPELKRRLHSPELAQLSQRIAVSYHLGALTPEEIKEYISFRLEKVDGRPEIFAEETFPLIYQASGGIPRIINLLCDTALVYGYAENLARINQEVMSQVIRDKGGLGLIVNEQQTGENSIAREEHNDDNSPSRLLALEEKVASMQQQIDWRLAEIAQNGTRSNDRLIAELRELLHNEREKNDALLSAYSKLKAGVGD